MNIIDIENIYNFRISRALWRPGPIIGPSAQKIKSLKYRMNKYNEEVDRFVLAINSVLSIISQKMNKELGFINYLANSNPEKLKTLPQPILGEHFKHYNLLFTSQMLLIKHGSIVRCNDGDISASQTQININTESIIENIKFFANLYDPTIAKQKTSGEKPISNLSDTIAALTVLAAKIKNFKTTTKIKKVKGGHEYIPYSKCGGGYVSKDKTITVILGGKSENKNIVVGYEVDSRIENNIRIVKNWKAKEDFFKKVIVKELWSPDGLFPLMSEEIDDNPLSTFRELQKLCTNSNNYLQYLNLDYAYKKQLDEIKNSNIVETLRQYVLGHAKKYLEKDITIKDGDTPIESMHIIMDTLDTIDDEILEKNRIQGGEKGYRYKLKDKIREYLKDLDEPQLPKCKSDFVFMSEASFNKLPIDDQVAYIIEIVTNLTDYEKSISDQLHEYEDAQIARAQNLGSLFFGEEITALYTPGVVEPCILNEIAFRKK